MVDSPLYVSLCGASRTKSAGRGQLETKFAISGNARLSPSRVSIEALRPGSGTRGQPQRVTALFESVRHHCLQQGRADALPFVLWVDKQRPDASFSQIDNAESQDLTVAFKDPAATDPFEHPAVIVFGNASGIREAVFVHRHPDG